MSSSGPFVVVAVGLLVTACEQPLEDIVPPARPEWVQKSVPYAWEELGIDAENVGRQQIKLQWRRVPDEDLAGYRIYRKLDEDTARFEFIGAVDLFQIVGTDTVYYDPYVEVGKRCFYFIRSVDNADNQSEPSDTIYYMLLSPPLLVNPIKGGSADRIPTFTWWQQDEQFDYASYFAIRLQDATDPYAIRTVWTCFLSSPEIGASELSLKYFGAEEYIDPGLIDNVHAFNVDSAYVDGLPSGTYRWKVKRIHTVDDSLRDESSGESEWGYFEVE